jgi:TolB-like protein
MASLFAKSMFIVLVAIAPPQKERKDILSVLYFQNTTRNKEYDWLSKGIADMLISDISKSYQLEVVERENLEKILKEQKLSLSGLTDESKAIEVGKLLNANKMVSGSYIVLGTTIRVDTKITDIETGKILKSVESSGTINDVFSLEKALAENILTHFNSKIPDQLNVRETNSPDASKTYYEGMALLDEGKSEKAIEKFQQATEIDPLYSKPQKNLEEAYQFLKDFKKAREQRELTKLYDKAEKLRARAEGKTFRTYAEIIREYMSTSRTQEELERFNDQNNIYLIANTRAQCMWMSMMTYIEITQVYERTGNTKMERRLYEENVSIAERAKETYKGDPFLPEILSLQLTSFMYLENYTKVKEYAEKFLKAYPDYRMIQSVEDDYEKALQNLK